MIVFVSCSSRLTFCSSSSPPSSPPVANGSDSKKFKGDSPSKVVHIRKLPDDITETEVISLGLPFGSVSNLLMLKTKNQVLERC